MIECSYKNCEWNTTKMGVDKKAREQQALRMHVARIHTKIIQPPRKRSGFAAYEPKPEVKRTYRRRVVRTPEPLMKKVRFICPHCSCFATIHWEEPIQ